MALLIRIFISLDREAWSHRLDAFVHLSAVILFGRWLSADRWWLDHRPVLRRHRCIRILLLWRVVIVVHRLIVVVVPALAQDVLEVVVDLLRQVELVLVDKRLVEGVKQVGQAAIHLILGREQILVADYEILLDLVVFDAVFLTNLMATQELDVLFLSLWISCSAIVLLADHVAGGGEVVLVTTQAIA